MLVCPFVMVEAADPRGRRGRKKLGVRREPREKRGECELSGERNEKSSLERFK